MVNRLTLITALVAVFGVAFSFIAQNSTDRPGSAFASESGSGCSYSLGIVCKLNRTDPADAETF